MANSPWLASDRRPRFASRSSADLGPHTNHRRSYFVQLDPSYAAFSRKTSIPSSSGLRDHRPKAGPCSGFLGDPEKAYIALLHDLGYIVNLVLFSDQTHRRSRKPSGRVFCGRCRVLATWLHSLPNGRDSGPQMEPTGNAAGSYPLPSRRGHGGGKSRAQLMRPNLDSTQRGRLFARGCRAPLFDRHKLSFFVPRIDLARTRDFLLRIGNQLLPLC
jgi:hypothetical protein